MDFINPNELTNHVHKRNVTSISKNLVLSELVHKPAKATVFNVNSIHRSNKQNIALIILSVN